MSCCDSSLIFFVEPRFFAINAPAARAARAATASARTSDIFVADFFARDATDKQRGCNHTKRG